MKRTKKDKDIVVFIVRRDSVCCECGEELFSGRFIHLSDKGAACLSCADLDHLSYLPRGNAALTRRARKNSGLSAVVLQWSRTRRRYERQGILASPEAIEKAEEECLDDEELREARRIKAREKREEAELKYVNEFAKEIISFFPGCPPGREFKIADFACRKYYNTTLNSDHWLRCEKNDKIGTRRSLCKRRKSIRRLSKGE